jgi:uncharacterized repeat protein (TIGR03803 family)
MSAGTAAWLAIVIGAGASLFGQTETVLHTFQAGSDGYYPELTPLVLDGAGNLYGTTTYGGGGPCFVGFYAGCGVIYQLRRPSPAQGSWTENVIWRFQSGADGGYPGGLVVAAGKLFGVAGTGGTGTCSGGCGYLFEITPPTAAGGAWSKMDVFDFPAADTSCSISASDAGGNLYGVGGGTAVPNGTICKLIRPVATGESWAFTNLYEFRGVARGHSIGDGSGPLGVTFDRKGNLWGATASGGYCQQFEGGSCFGTLFLLTPPSTPAGTWTESVLHRFSNGDQNPISGVVIDKAGALYGITYVETYRFSGGALAVIGTFSDCQGCGYAPTGGVVLDSAGNVYGVTAAGGQFGYGTVYKLALPNYSQVVLHSFAAGTDGWNPEGPLIRGPDGTLYGTTQDGGNQGCQLGFGSVGCGIIFEVTP